MKSALKLRNLNFYGTYIMIKKTIFLLLSTLLFVACVERGQTLQPRDNIELFVKNENSIETNSTETIQIMDTNRTQATDTEIIDFSFLNLTDETKNTLSGIAIILIGIMMLL